MKHIFMVAAIITSATACHRATIPTVTPIINTEIRNESGQTILVGRATISAMQMPNYKIWFDDWYNKYSVDAASTQQLKSIFTKQKNRNLSRHLVWR